jgi:hypothetical protein
MVLRNLGGDLNAAPLPSEAVEGLGYTRAFGGNGSQKATVYLDCAEPWVDASASSVTVGVEYILENVGALRTAYDFAGEGSVSEASFGGGLCWKGLGLDYACVVEGVLGLSNEWSLSARF